ncbi:MULTISPECIES: YkgJ family cysteine cluster protein [Geobacter]|uniref:Uncharacterized protein n=2 Tax=Geobacter TaxID=28231 RepID=A0A0C1QP64_9BACT|nr:MULTISPECIES: YkgJ family cysteine cluster protein [Geobacter]ANA40381.1 hypothetical protein A2G06_08835 [Geobacter anodireducens]KIE42387.1 hypothetical protein SE37_06980 [Geobacter soli]MBE2887104.1 YkgJ family cysteine cluster protein [Geobacter anodireducens]HMN01322.1 YkgJ family cysteine cluster protein [Geobacter anodireducens]
MEEILDHYGSLLSRIDDWFRACLGSSGDRIRCADGCSDCCRGLFDITLLDAAFLRRGFDRLDPEVRGQVLDRCRERIAGLGLVWPEFDQPFILNMRPEDEWEALMPDDDETPCPLLDQRGRCLVYGYRPMTCRLHGLPLIDVSGEIMHDEWCTLNYMDADPLADPALRGDFNRIFTEEVRLIRTFAGRLLGHPLSEVDTFIPTALVIAFDSIDWLSWGNRLAALSLPDAGSK